MIRDAVPEDLDEVLSVINDSALAYKGVISAEIYREPFVSAKYLDSELGNGVKFTVYHEDGRIIGVMGTQDREDVTLIRHSYVLSSHRQRGIGSALIGHHINYCDSPMLVGCLKAMTWAIDFYQKHGFTLLSDPQRDVLRAKYWTLPPEHVRQSVVLADSKWLRDCSAGLGV